MKPGKALTHILTVTPTIKSHLNNFNWKTQSTNNVFNDLLSCVIEQQIIYRSTKKIFANALDKSGLKELTLKNFETFEKEGLATLKLSAQKFETINNVVNFFTSNNVNFNALTEKEIRTTLKQIKGVGEWSINMILIYTLGYKNVFDSSDYHIKKAMKMNFNFEKPSEIKKFAEVWSPYKSIAFRLLVRC